MADRPAVDRLADRPRRALELLAAGPDGDLGRGALADLDQLVALAGEGDEWKRHHANECAKSDELAWKRDEAVDGGVKRGGRHAIVNAAEEQKMRDLGMPVRCCDYWPECSHMLAWIEADGLKCGWCEEHGVCDPANCPHAESAS